MSLDSARSPWNGVEYMHDACLAVSRPSLCGGGYGILPSTVSSVPRSSRKRRWLQRLKHAFLPHHGNGYHPHLLRDHHLVGHAAFFTGIKIVLILGATLIPAEAFLAPDILAEQASALVQLTNRAREEQGLKTLSVSSLLVRSSGLRAHDMAEKSYFSHVSPDGHRLSYFLKAAGYAYHEAGENLAMGFSDAQSAMQGWMKSPTHYANVVDPVFSEVGISVEGGVMNGKPTVFVAQHFGSPYQDDATAAPEPAQEHPVPAQGERVAEQGSSAVAGVKTQTTVASAPRVVTIRSKAAVPQTAAALPADPVATKPSLPVISTTTIVAAALIDDTVPLQDTSISLDRSLSSLVWHDEGTNTRLEVRAVIRGGITTAEILVENYVFALREQEPGVYVGAFTVPESSDRLFRVIISPTIRVTKADGTRAVQPLDWTEPKIVSETPWQRYVQARSWLSRSIPVYSLVRGFFFAAAIAFAGMILVTLAGEFRKQHPHILLKTMALVGLLLLYTTF